MSSTPASRPSEIVIAGSGVGALELALTLTELAGDAVRLRIVTPATEFHWRAHDLDTALGRGHVESHPVDSIAARARAEVVAGSVEAVEADSRTFVLDTGERLPYDTGVIAVGARAVPAFEHAWTLWPGTDLGEAVGDIASGFAQRVLIVIPKGTGWTLPAYVLAIALAERGTSVGIVTPEAVPLEGFGAVVGSTVSEIIRRLGVTLHVVAQPDVPAAGAVRLPNGWLEADRILTLPGLSGPALAGVPADVGGFVLAGPDGLVTGTDSLYAIGDAVAGVIPSGGLAALAAGRLGATLARAAGATGVPEPDRVFVRGVLPTADGPLYLEADPADPSHSVVSREALWWPAQRVAAPPLARFAASVIPEPT